MHTLTDSHVTHTPVSFIRKWAKLGTDACDWHCPSDVGERAAREGQAEMVHIISFCLDGLLDRFKQNHPTKAVLMLD